MSTGPGNGYSGGGATAVRPNSLQAQRPNSIMPQEVGPAPGPTTFGHQLTYANGMGVLRTVQLMADTAHGITSEIESQIDRMDGVLGPR